MQELGCPLPYTDVDVDEARELLEPYWAAALERFLAYEEAKLGTSKLSKVRLLIETWGKMQELEGFRSRNFAATRDDGSRVVLVTELVELPPDTVAAIIAHELGHALDFLHPGTFFSADGELVVHAGGEPDDKRGNQARIARSKQWAARSRDEEESVADLVAEQALGSPIGYAGPCTLQTFVSHTPRRPEGLR